MDIEAFEQKLKAIESLVQEVRNLFGVPEGLTKVHREFSEKERMMRIVCSTAEGEVSRVRAYDVIQGWILFHDHSSCMDKIRHPTYGEITQRDVDEFREREGINV